MFSTGLLSISLFYSHLWWDSSCQGFPRLYWSIILNYRDMIRRSQAVKELSRWVNCAPSLQPKLKRWITDWNLFWDTWGPSEQRHWLIQYCTIVKMDFILKDSSSGVWDDSEYTRSQAIQRLILITDPTVLDVYVFVILDGFFFFSLCERNWISALLYVGPNAGIFIDRGICSH